MSMMFLKEYQKKAVKKLTEHTIEILDEERDYCQSLVLKAPTGSGKTVMMQAYLKDLADLGKWDFAFVRISVSDLARQSKKNFQKNLQGSKLIFSELSDIQDRVLRQNEVLFINREALKQKNKTTGEWKVLAMRDNERNENLPTYLKNAHNEWRKIILIVDESHIALDTNKAQELIGEYIKPIIQIEVSATPDTRDYRAQVEVYIDDVIKEEMIKKEILINPNIQSFLEDQEWTDEIIIRAALEKQRFLWANYQEHGSNIKPLLLIQLPSEKKTTEAIDQTKLERTQRILGEYFDISLENQKLALWLTNDKTNKDLIDIPNSPVEVLIFKQAIATGWDCPRAQILVMFREIKKVTFEIQTIGRILRMPEWKHYADDALNKAYVFTDLPKQMIGIHDTAKNLIKSQYVYRNKTLYTTFHLESFFKSRVDYQDIWSSFRSFVAQSLLEKIGWEEDPFKREQNKSKLAKHIDLDNDCIADELIADWKMQFWSQNIIIKDGINRKKIMTLDDFSQENVLITSTVKTNTQDELIQMAFENFARDNVRTQFSNIARSYKSIIESLYLSLDHFFFGEQIKRSYYQRIILNNQDFFIEVLNTAKDKYLPIKQELIAQKTNQQEKTYLRTIPQSQAFNDLTKEYNYQKNIMQPSILKFDSREEQDFVEKFLEVDDRVCFRYKNGISSKEYFGIPYIEWEEKHTFYPDFIVYFQDNSIWIFDPKKGFTLEEARSKALWLEYYIKNHNNQKIIGGLIKQENGTFYINNKASFDTTSSSDFSLLSSYLDSNLEF